MSDPVRPPIPDDVPDNEPIEDIEPLPMQPTRRSTRHLAGREDALRPREPISALVERAREPEPPPQEDYPPIPPRIASRQADPLFAYLFIVSLGIGMAPLDPQIRFVVLWTLMGILGAMGYLLGAVERMREARIDDLVWGMLFGFLSTFPFFLVFGPALTTVSERMFNVEGTPARVMDTWVFMAVTFVLPLTEALFFRGAMQGVRSLLLTTFLSTIWSCVLFFPHMSLAGREVIGLILLLVFSLLNFMYSYVRLRNGLAAAWLCQTVSYSLLWFLPRVV